MDLVEAITKRRSISQFQPRDVDRKVIDHLIETSGFTPSSCNTQPWFYLIFDSNESKRRLNEYVDEGYQETKKVLKERHKLTWPIYAKALEVFSEYGKFDHAPAQILLFARPYDAAFLSQLIKISGESEIERISQDSVKTSAAMSMNSFVLLAHSLNLGTRVKDGVKFMIEHPELRARFYREFDVPNEFELVSGIQLGYPTSKALERKAHKRKPLEVTRRYV